MAYLKKPYFPAHLETPLALLSVPELTSQLQKRPADSIVLFINPHGQHARHFPLGVKAIAAKDYHIHTYQWRDGSHDLDEYLIDSLLITFDNLGESLKHIFYNVKDPSSHEQYGDGEHPHMTVQQFMDMLSPYNHEKNYFITPGHKKGTYVSPDMVMNYNNETYKILNPNNELLHRDKGMNGEIVCFGIGTTMEDTVINIEPKTAQEEKLNETKNNFKRFIK